MSIKLYKIKSDETIIDAVINTYGNLNNVYSFILLNNLDSIESVLIPTTDLSYNTNLINFKPSQLYLNTITLSPTKVIKTFDYQSTYDVCLQNYGTLDKMYELITNNDFISVDDSDIQLKDIIIKTNLEVQNYKKISAKFATLDKIAGELNKYYILLENDFYLLFEDGFKIEQEN